MLGKSPQGRFKKPSSFEFNERSMQYNPQLNIWEMPVFVQHNRNVNMCMPTLGQRHYLGMTASSYLGVEKEIPLNVYDLNTSNGVQP